MRGAALLLALLLSAGAATADVARPRDLETLLAVLQNAALATGDATEVQIRDDKLYLTWKGTALIADPHNLFMEMQQAASDAERQKLVDTYFAAFDDILQLDTGVLDPASLMPIIRPSTFAEHIPDAKSVASEPWFAGLSIYLVEDSPSSTAYLRDDRMLAAGLDFETAKKQALANLSTLSPRFEPLGPKRWGLALDGYYESSLLLESELWRRMAEDQGEIIMVVPSRDAVVIDASGDPAAVQELAIFAQESGRARPYPVSEYVFGWKGTHWEILPKQ
ncbi:uncharacterized protein YtpQ (UPF0354 family) [Rhodobacter sp. JA431]|uniref:DUF1444 family protein n=1 Tax=Rhodobacter sp. JA431 TaxID=570013 RepID=UPI000BCA8760|nr:DUF1444 family protein [Rhodobacter sp. JA431]SOC11024.1 uncharacterized protein YtpQ (UPF0354 family) [Rhodobacter sp. JA431]